MILKANQVVCIIHFFKSLQRLVLVATLIAYAMNKTCLASEKPINCVSFLRLRWGVFFIALCRAEYDWRVVIKGRSGARDDGLYTKKNRCKTKVLQRLSAFEDFSDAHSEGILKPFCGERG